METKAGKSDKPIYYIYRLQKPANILENKGFFYNNI